METISIDKDIVIFYIPAKSFPDGILEAHQKLHSMVPFSKERNYFGVSRPENGVIAYKAAAEELTEGEGEKYHCKTLILKKGKYINLTVKDFKNNIPEIDKAFKKLLTNPDIDPEGYCVEWYANDDVRCMVRLR